MKWMTFSLLALAGLAIGACERHSASELAGEHGVAQAAPAAPDKVATPLSPEGVPTNPAGAGPVDTKTGDKKGTATGTKKFFPDSN
jgi:hypothetical protein